MTKQAKALNAAAKRKKVQEEPWKSEEFGSAHLTNAHHPLIVINSDTSIRYVNPALENLTGFSSSELIGRKAPYPWWTEEILQKTGRDQVEVMRKEAQGIEELFQRKNGKRFWVEVTSTPVRTNGGLKYYLVSWMDITERKRVEEALRVSEEKYKTLTDSSLTGIFIHQDGKYVFVNAKFAEIHDYKPEELLGKEYSTLISPTQRDSFAKMVSARLRGEAVAQRYEVQRLRKNGQTIWCEMMAVRIEYGGSPAIMGNIVDINDRKLAEEALQEREAAFKAQAHKLEEVNTALKVLLKHREKDKADLQEKVLLNVKELVLPYAQTLKSSPLNAKQMAYVDIIESNLNTIVSPFLQKLSSKYLGLTPKEIQVAGLVKEGKTNKEIAELLNISARSIEFHRENIRTKFGLKNRKVNLRSYLISLA